MQRVPGITVAIAWALQLRNSLYVSKGVKACPTKARYNLPPHAIGGRRNGTNAKHGRRERPPRHALALFCGLCRLYRRSNVRVQLLLVSSNNALCASYAHRITVVFEEVDEEVEDEQEE